MDGAVLPFHEQQYIPFGASMSTAPVVCTPQAVIRRVYELMALDRGGDVLLDLGCGLGAVLNAVQLRFVQSTSTSSYPTPPLRCIGVDLRPEALDEARAGAAKLQLPHMAFHQLDITEDVRDVVQLWQVTKTFVYLTPSQLLVPTVKALLTSLHAGGVQICSYDYPITYLSPEWKDVTFNLFEYHVQEQ